MTATAARLSRRHLANVIGAFVTAYADALRQMVEDDSRERVPAAIMVLHTWPDRSVEFLAGVLQLTHSGAVRLVDRLVGDGLAARHPGPDRRTVALRLTARGTARARRVRAARYELLLDVVDALTPAERAAVGHALDRVLRQVPRSRTGARRACRLCDHSVCRGTACPIGASATEPA